MSRLARMLSQRVYISKTSKCCVTFKTSASRPNHAAVATGCASRVSSYFTQPSSGSISKADGYLTTGMPLLLTCKASSAAN